MFIPIIVVIIGLIMILVEARAPGRKWPEVRGWWARAFLFNGTQAAMVYLAGNLWDGWMRDNRVWSAEGLGTVGGAILGYLVMTFIYYWWHRARHEVPFLWRWFHQLHHSPQRLEIVTSFYKHPFEILANAVLSSTVMYLVVGLSAEAAMGVTLLAGLAELFYHWNLKTPHWLGYIVQRPESHCVHHEEGKHHYNYGDLAVWDMLFGTFHNPKEFESRCGFGEDEHRVGEMLIGRDLTDGIRLEHPVRLVALALLGTLGMAGHVFANPTVKGLAAATAAAPAPKVFTSIDGWETYSAEFALEWEDDAGRHHLKLSPEVYPRIQGPYNRRNVFGAVLAYGPLLSTNELTQPMYLDAARYALCPEYGAIALEELGIGQKSLKSLTVVYEPLAGTPVHHPRRIDAPCDWSKGGQQ